MAGITAGNVIGNILRGVDGLVRQIQYNSDRFHLTFALYLSCSKTPPTI